MQLIRKKKISQLPLLESTTENTYIHVVDNDENYRIEADKITASFASKTYVDQQDALKVDKVDGKSLIADTEISRLAGVDNQTLSGLGGEPSANKQDSLAVDGNGVKFPTVDAVNSGLSTKPEKTTQVVAGAGLTGGGTLESDRTLNVVSANDGITVNADNIQLNAVDNLASTSATRPLSANQGRALDAAKVDKVAGKSLILDTEISRLASVTNQTLSGLGGEAVVNKKQTVTNSATDYPSGAAVTASIALKTDISELNKIYPLYNYNVRLGLDSGTVGNLEELTKLYTENLALLDSTVFLWSGVAGMKTRTSGSNQFASKLYNMANKVQQFGPELVTNGTFTTNTSGWTGNVATMTVDANRLKVVNSGTYGNVNQVISTVIGKTYHISFSFTYVDCPGVVVLLNVGGTLTLATGLIASTTRTYSFVATNTTTNIILQNSSSIAGFTTMWDNISVKQMDWVEGTNDAVQTTEANQPYVSGTIAPNEVRKLKSYIGSSYYVNFTSITFASNSPWSISFIAKNNGSNGNSSAGMVIGDVSTSWIGYDQSGNRLSFRNKNGDIVTTNTNTAPFNEIGKNSFYSVIANGANNLSIFKNGALFLSIAVDTTVLFSKILDSLSSANRQLNGELHHLQIFNRALSASEIQAQHYFLRSQIPEIEGVAIGNQYWATSNYEGVVAGDGSVINEVKWDKSDGTGTNNSPELMTNTGLSGSTDWIDSNGDGLADGFMKSSNSLTSIVTGNGFIGRAQRIEESSGGQLLFINPMSNVGVIAGKTYRVRIRYRASKNFNVSLPNIAVIKTLPMNVGDAIYTSFYHTPTTVNPSYQFYNLSITMAATGDFFEIDEWSVQEAAWADSTAAYDAVYAQTSGTAAQKELVALKAAAMWCYYSNDVNIGAVIGKEYNGYALKLLALYPPAGYRVPFKADIEQLVTYLGGSSVAGTKLKAVFGVFNNSFSTNESGFSALPVGSRLDNGSFTGMGSEVTIRGIDGRLYLQSTTNTAPIFTVDSDIRGYYLRLLRNSPVGQNETTVTTGTIVNALGAGNLDIVIPFGYAVDSINVISKTGITGLSAKYCNRNQSTLAVTELDTLFTAKTVVANTPKLFNCNVDQTIQRQDAVVRINGTKADTAAEFEVIVNIKKTIL